MCGIVGIASKHTIADRGWLAVGRDMLRHRGPDDAGEWWAPDGRVGFGHRRLAIIDLSANGHQPMLDRNRELAITFNGEIYNFAELRDELLGRGHVFVSASDTEVVLAAYREWGTRCLERLRGMFAFALCDLWQRRLLLARDRAGEKPLFYWTFGDSIRFASELKGLLADASVPRRIDAGALDCYLAQGFVAGERCILQGMRKLRPAHALLFELDSGSSREWCYWQLGGLDARAADAAAGELCDELEQRLETAVRRQLVADVPLGILLSGGVDSSLVTAMAARAASHVKTFTVRFPGHGRYDETDHARLIASHFGTEHSELEAEATTIDMLPMLARQFDEPIVDSSMVPTYLVSRLVRQHCTVALGGDGGDELFGGYSHYDRLLWMERKLGWIPRPLRMPLALAARSWLPPGFKGRNWLQGLATDLRSDVPVIATYFDCVQRRRLANGRTWMPTAERVHRERVPKGGDLLQRATRLDFTNYLPDDILVKVDRASMLSSLEVRAPMLDVDVVEFAFTRVPSRLKTTSTTRKVVLKELAKRVLPPTFDRTRKQGFSIPIESWLRSGPWREYFRAVLLDKGQSAFAHDVVEKLFAGQDKGRANGERLFALVMFELWRREYRVEL